MQRAKLDKMSISLNSKYQYSISNFELHSVTLLTLQIVNFEQRLANLKVHLKLVFDFD